MNRRRFLASTSASVFALNVLKPGLAFGAEANAKIDIGLIGCGGRGKWIAKLFAENSGYNLVAASDYFRDRVDAVGEQFTIPAAKRFTGLSGYKRLLEQPLDAVVIETPPYFHPEQAATAIDAGRHVYLAKPIAVDVPGCQLVEESGRKATAKKLCFLVDFQTRANKLYQEAVKKVSEGEIGRIISVEAAYHCGFTWDRMDAELRKNPKDPETRLRAWGVDRVLSGDVITEQNIHALDVATWMLDAAPERAYGTGGRSREFIGDCWDHFAVIFYYPDNLFVSFNSKQAGFGFDDILCRVHGMKGTVDTHYFGKVSVTATEFRSTGDVGNLYSDGVKTNIQTFYESITKGEWSNATVAASVRSNLTTILGRMAAYKNGIVTWNEMLRGGEKFAADLNGLQA